MPQSGQVGCIDLLDLESGLSDEPRNVAGYVAALECPLKKRLCPRREPV